MWLLVAIPLIIFAGNEPVPVATFPTKTSCEKTAAVWNADLEFLKRQHYMTFACWTPSHPELRKER